MTPTRLSVAIADAMDEAARPAPAPPSAEPAAAAIARAPPLATASGDASGDAPTPKPAEPPDPDVQEPDASPAGPPDEPPSPEPEPLTTFVEPSSPAVEAAAPPAAPDRAPASPPPPPGRGGALSWLRRPLDRLRAFLAAPVRADLHALRLDGESLQRALRLDGESLRSALSEQRGLSELHLAELRRTTARLEQAEAGVAALLNWTPAVNAALGHGNHQADAAAVRLDQALALLHEAARRLEVAELRQTVLMQAARTAQAQAAGVGGGEIVKRLDALAGFSARLDELEIKLRPVLPLDGGSTGVRTADGYVMLPSADPLFVLQVANATSGGLEPGVRRVLRALLEPGDACADVGANVGLLTLAMARCVGPEGRVWAFEPEARVREQLARTTHLNGLAQVRLSGDAVGARAGRLTFNESPIIGHSSLYALPPDEQAGARAVEVPVTRLDDVVPPGTPLKLVKIDVEGAELDVLAGMERVIADSPELAVIAEYGPSHLARIGVEPSAWFDAFAAHGWTPHLVSEPHGVVTPTRAEALAGVASANLVFTRPGSRTEARLPR